MYCTFTSQHSMRKRTPSTSSAMQSMQSAIAIDIRAQHSTAQHRARGQRMSFRASNSAARSPVASVGAGDSRVRPNNTGAGAGLYSTRARPEVK